MAAGVADITDIEGYLVRQFALQAKIVTVGGRNLSGSIGSQDSRGRSERGSVHQGTRKRADVAAIDSWRVDGWGVADASKIEDVLLIAFVEHAKPAAERRFAVAENIIGKAEARS